MSDDVPRFWSVTTILNTAVAKPQLKFWAAKVVAETAVDRLDTIRQMVERDGDRDAAVDFLKRSIHRRTAASMARGSKVHAAAEELNLGVEPKDLLKGKMPPEALPFVEQYRRFLNEHQPEFVLAEAPVYNPSQGYAGTLDAVVRIDGGQYVLDVKTQEETRDPYPETALQLVAYARAEQVAIRGSAQRDYNGRRYYVLADGAQLEPMPEVSQDMALILTISPTDYQLVPVRIDDEVWNYFRVAAAMARWDIDAKGQVIGTPIAVPAARAAAA